MQTPHFSYVQRMDWNGKFISWPAQYTHALHIIQTLEIASLDILRQTKHGMAKMDFVLHRKVATRKQIRRTLNIIMRLTKIKYSLRAHTAHSSMCQRDCAREIGFNSSVNVKGKRAEWSGVYSWNYQFVRIDNVMVRVFFCCYSNEKKILLACCGKMRTFVRTKLTGCCSIGIFNYPLAKLSTLPIVIFY